MAKAFVFDAEKCVGCYNCQIVCKDEHVDNDWAPIARPQPEIGQFWLRLDEHVCGSRPKVKIHFIPNMCNHCRNAPCIAAAENGAVYRRDDGLIVIDTEKAVGQKQLAEACPYGAIYWNEELSLAQKCTGCAHLLDAGYPAPRCVEACPTDALLFGEEDELAEYIRGAQVMKPEAGTSPRVYYRNIPGQFITGTLFNAEEDRVIIGATCRLNNGGKVWEVLSDDFGDFWFKDLAVGYYDLVIEAEGYKTKVIKHIDAGECVNLGDFELEKE